MFLQSFDLRIIDQAAEGVGEHAQFGVLDPSEANPINLGIGRKIALKNDSGSNLAQLIIGNEVEGLNNTRYVRKPDENAGFVLNWKTLTMLPPNLSTG